MLFVAHTTLVAERSRETLEELKKLKPHAGITMKGMYAVFGRHDILMIFEAENEKSCIDFILDIRNLGGVIDTETALAADLKQMEEA